MKKILSLILAAVMLFSLTACSSSTSDKTDATPVSSEEAASADTAKTEQTVAGGTIKIGLICGLTGAQPLEGKHSSEAVEMAMNEINANGGVLGCTLEAVVLDDALSADQDIICMTNLCENEDVVAVMGPPRTGSVTAVSSIVAEYGMPTLVSGTGVSIYDLNNEYMFRVRASDKIFAKMAAKYMVEELGCKKVGVMYNNDDFGNGGLDVIQQYISEEHPEVEVVSEGHTTGDVDMSGQLLKLKDAGCDGMITWTNGAESIVIARQFYELSLAKQMKFLGSAGIGNSEFYTTVSAEAGNGVYGVVDFVKTAENVQTFVENFRAAYGDDPDLGASAYYDAVYVLAAAIERASVAERTAIRDALLETDQQGNQGHLYCDENRDLIHQCMIYQYDGSSGALEQKLIGVVTEE